MDFNVNSSPSSSSTFSSTPHPMTTTTSDPMHSWWESISKARSQILALSSIISDLSLSFSSSFSLSTLADSDRPALSFLSSPDAYLLLSSALSAPHSGSGPDPLCQWLYETYLSNDPHLRLIVLSFLPLISGIYLSRLHYPESSSSSLPSLAGFEAVLLAIYSSEAKSRAGKAITVQIPDLAQPSLYHTPRNRQSANIADKSGPSVGILCPPLEHQNAVKSTKRATIVGVALDCYFKQISQMPSWSKVEFCKFATAWAGQDCLCEREFDGDDETEKAGYFLEDAGMENGNDEIGDVVVEKMSKLGIDNDNAEDLKPKGLRIPLPWELLQPMLRILGHCLLGPLNSQDVKDAASMAVRRLYARASHDINPQAILATRSLIQLNKRASAAAKAAAAANSSSNVNTPSKAKKPEVLLVSK
ncbi:hypothetical protein HS088_TW08G00511 [Tripterygium wilfordii]|uniref:Hyccin n=1 Tax=Tripterygium wilfordii TaxID=458696 RepID=A0A7J7DC64_TRIWF|nr:uncharacterized protein LOC120003267 [Tripterygium wilfordii]KAF5743923.1 hypothetical protein HS088_TW08G00511 [Tripterygium wilfordii]